MLINYIVHSTSEDNEKRIVSGKYDTLLSNKGLQQAKQLNITLQIEPQNIWGQIFSSTLNRAYNTANIVFEGYNINLESRLNEIDYGSYTHKRKQEIDLIKTNYINKSFPEGESYVDVEKRIRSFLKEYKIYKIITIISHRAPQLALDVICNKKTWLSAFNSDWRTYNPALWKPFWRYFF